MNETFARHVEALNPSIARLVDMPPFTVSQLSDVALPSKGVYPFSAEACSAERLPILLRESPGRSARQPRAAQRAVDSGFPVRAELRSHVPLPRQRRTSPHARLLQGTRQRSHEQHLGNRLPCRVVTVHSLLDELTKWLTRAAPVRLAGLRRVDARDPRDERAARCARRNASERVAVKVAECCLTVVHIAGDLQRVLQP
jgi:hypothetical protein